MILHIEYDYMTKEEAVQLKELESKGTASLVQYRRCKRETKELLKEAGKEDSNIQSESEEETKYLNEWIDIQKEIISIEQAILDRYLASIAGRIRKINIDAKKVLDALEYEDFLKYVQEQCSNYFAYLTLQKKKTDQKELDQYRDMQIQYSVCIAFINSVLNIQLESCKAEYNNGKALNDSRIKKLIKQKAIEWGFKPEAKAIQLPSLFDNSNVPMYHGRATDTLARMSSRGAQFNRITNSATIENSELKVVMQKFTDLQGTLGVNTHKLLSVGIARFTAVNNYDRKGKSSLQYTVEIPLEIYASSLGYSVTEKETDTAEEAEAEKKRAKNAMKDAKKRIRRDLDTLASMELTWEEKVKGKAGDYQAVHLIGTRGIKNGYITMTFDPQFSEYLAKLPITQYPISLLGVDARNSNAYSIGLKFAEHYNIDNNQVTGTANRLKVETILAYTTLPDINSPTVKKVGWENRIKEPFETALDELTGKLLKDWKYTASKGIELSYEEATVPKYEEWKEFYVQFELADPVDHTERLEKRKEERRARAKRASQKKKTK